MSGLEELSREELLALIAGQAQTIELLTARLERLEAENVELKRRLAQNSRNSSRSPSADGLAGAESAGVVRRQVNDVPAMSVTVTEHRLHRRRCACGTLTTADGPAGVACTPASYGPNLRAWAVYLLVFQHIPVARLIELISDLTGAQPSTGGRVTRTV